jgi:uncharacterized protein DUF6916
VLESATSETFAPHIGSSFEARTNAGDVLDLELTSCDESPESGPPGAARVPFSLIFHDADASRYAPQQTFLVRHDALGTFALFMVPLGADDRGMRYQAVIS